MSEVEQEKVKQPNGIFPTYQQWWEGQVSAALPRWRRGTYRHGFQDCFVSWPLHREALILRLTHLASLEAHS